MGKERRGMMVTPRPCIQGRGAGGEGCFKHLVDASEPDVRVGSTEEIGFQPLH